jgi:hypothetical protein
MAQEAFQGVYRSGRPADGNHEGPGGSPCLLLVAFSGGSLDGLVTFVVVHASTFGLSADDTSPGRSMHPPTPWDNAGLCSSVEINL